MLSSKITKTPLIHPNKHKRINLYSERKLFELPVNKAKINPRRYDNVHTIMKKIG